MEEFSSLVRLSRSTGVACYIPVRNRRSIGNSLVKNEGFYCRSPLVPSTGSTRWDVINRRNSVQ